MISLCLALSSFRCSSPPDPTDRYLLRGDSIAALLSATRRAREGKCVGALQTRPAISLKPTAGKSALMHLLCHIRNRILLPCPFHLPFADPVWAMDEVESLRLGGLQTRPIWLGAQGRRTRRRRKRRRPISGDERMAPAPTPPATATMATTAMTPSAVLCGEFHSLGGA